MILLRIGGIINLLLAVFHLLFWTIFDWPDSLACLSAEQSSIMQVLNIHLAIGLVLFGYVSLFNGKELQTSRLGMSVQFFIAFFYIARAINEVLFWGLSGVVAIVLFVCWLSIGALYAYTWNQSRLFLKLNS